MKTKNLLNYLFWGISVAMIITSCSVFDSSISSGNIRKVKVDGFAKNSEKCSLNERNPTSKINKANNYRLDYLSSYQSGNLILANTLPDEYLIASTEEISLMPINTETQDNSRNNNFLSFLSDSCDIIILKNGNEIASQVLEIGINEIKYKDCRNLTGPSVTISKADVFMIKYKNGTSSVIKDDSGKVANNGNNEKNIEIFSLIGFITSIVGLFVAGIILGIASLILSGIGLGKLSKNPEKLKGKGYAIAGIIIGAIDIIAAIVLVLLIL